MIVPLEICIFLKRNDESKKELVADANYTKPAIDKAE